MKNAEMNEFKEDFQLEEALAPKKTRFEDFWLIFRQNRLAIIGFFIFVLFFFSAVASLILTSGHDPLFDPPLIRLQEKLLPPLAKPNFESLPPEAVPALGIYLMGTDDLGRDVFARMLQGAWVSLTFFHDTRPRHPLRCAATSCGSLSSLPSSQYIVELRAQWCFFR